MNSIIIVFGLVIVLVFSAGIASALSSPKPTVPFSHEFQSPKTPFLTLIKSASSSTIQVGETTTITIRVENTGTGDAKSVEVINRIPTGFKIVTGSVNVPESFEVDFDSWKGSHHRVPFHFKYGRFTPSSTLTAMKWL